MKLTYHKVVLSNADGINESWENEFKDGTHDLILIANSAKELNDKANKYSKYGTRWEIEHDNPRFTRLISKDCFGNTHYVTGYKF